MSGLLAQQLSGVYAGYQEAAGKAAGVEAGETWQVAFRAAVAAGALYYLHRFDYKTTVCSAARCLTDVH